MRNHNINQQIQGLFDDFMGHPWNAQFVPADIQNAAAVREWVLRTAPRALYALCTSCGIAATYEGLQETMRAACDETDRQSAIGKFWDGLNLMIDYLGVGLSADLPKEFKLNADILKSSSYEAIHRKAYAWMAWEARRHELIALNPDEETVIARWPDGWELVEMHSQNALKNEGHHMAHCIGGDKYGYDKRLNGRGGYHQFSLRKNGNSHVTIEMKDSVMVQCSGHNDGTPVKYKSQIMRAAKVYEWEIAKPLIEKISGKKHTDATQHEINAMAGTYDLSSAHALWQPTASQEKIIDRCSEFWRAANKTPQDEIENRFIKSFFASQGQDSAIAMGMRPIPVPSSSQAEDIIGAYLRSNKLSVSVEVPCFDNIVDQLKRREVSISPLPELYLHDADQIYENLARKIQSDTIFLFEPNNPTGFSMFKRDRKSFEELIRYAKDHDKLLIFDFCFASFLLPDPEGHVFDIYQMLEESGVRYIAVEDTGKIFPTQDQKAALIKCSADIHQDIYDICSEQFLRVSPVTLTMLTHFIQDGVNGGFAHTHQLLNENRQTLATALSGSLLELQPADATVSVAWLKITNPNVTATELKKELEVGGVHILPGTYFFWDNPSNGEQYMRVALARDPDLVTAAATRMRDIINTYSLHKGNNHAANKRVVGAIDHTL